MDSFRFDKYLMSVFICKPDDLVLNRRTVTRSGSLDHTGIKRRPVEIFPDDFMCLLICIGQPARYLLLLNRIRIGRKGERNDTFIALLLLHFRKIN